MLPICDDPLVCKLLRAALEKNSYAAIVCASGEEALASLREYAADTVILDVVLPNIELNLEQRTAWINNMPATLTYREFELLALLARNPGKVFTRDYLLDRLWQDEQFLETHTVDVHIRCLRRKIEEHGLNPDIIETIRSVGYRLSAD